MREEIVAPAFAFYYPKSKYSALRYLWAISARQL